MVTYKSLYSAMKDLQLPLDRLGDAVVNSVKTTLFENKARGKELSQGTINLKAQNKHIKLVEFGDLANATKKEVSQNSVVIGYTDEMHIRRVEESNQIPMNILAQIHNEGKYNLPKRSFLHENDEWLEEHKQTADEFVENHYKSKGII